MILGCPVRRGLPGACRLPSAEHAGGSGQEVIDVERLAQVVDHPELQGFDRALDRRVSGHQQDVGTAGRCRDAIEFADEFDPRHFGHHVVHDEQVERLLGQEVHRLPGTRALHDLVSFLLQRSPEQPNDFLFVIGDQDPTALRHDGRLRLRTGCQEGHGECRSRHVLKWDTGPPPTLATPPPSNYTREVPRVGGRWIGRLRDTDGRAFESPTRERANCTRRAGRQPVGPRRRRSEGGCERSRAPMLKRGAATPKPRRWAMSRTRDTRAE